MGAAIGESKQRFIGASEFAASCLRLIDDVAASGEAVVITKNGKPVSRLVPYRQKPATLFGALKGSIEIKGDLIEPVGVEWEAER